MPQFTVPMGPAPMPDPEPEDDHPPASRKVLDECQVFAHQSASGEDTLNVEIDAPAGVTVRVHINDWHALEERIPD